MTKGRGGGKTPERVVQLLNKAVLETSQSAVARATGLTQSAVHRYMKGIGEPSEDTLQKLAGHFEVSVEWLRGKSVKVQDIAGGLWVDMDDDNPAVVIGRVMQLAHMFIDELEQINSYEIKKRDLLKISFGFAVEFAFDTASKCMIRVDADFATTIQAAINAERARLDEIVSKRERNK